MWGSVLALIRPTLSRIKIEVCLAPGSPISTDTMNFTVVASGHVHGFCIRLIAAILHDTATLRAAESCVRQPVIGVAETQTTLAMGSEPSPIFHS